jgi:hypothetical protein
MNLFWKLWGSGCAIGIVGILLCDYLTSIRLYEYAIITLTIFGVIVSILVTVSISTYTTTKTTSDERTNENEVISENGSETKTN